MLIFRWYDQSFSGARFFFVENRVTHELYKFGATLLGIFNKTNNLLIYYVRRLFVKVSTLDQSHTAHNERPVSVSWSESIAR